MRRICVGCLFILPILLAFSQTTAAGRKEGVVIIDSTLVPRAQKEALIILPGLRSRSEGVKDIRNYFSHKGYDLFIPAYIGRDSIAQCVVTLDRFFNQERLSEYRKLHVFAYLLGGWTLNRWILQHPDNNIATIVYDRSPLQERAAYVAVHTSPLLTRMLAGPIVEEFSKTPYEGIPNDEKQIGIIMESRATRLVRRHKQLVLSLGELTWTVSDGKQDCDDYFYTLNNHDEMYHDFSVVGSEVLHFIRSGRFTSDAARVRPDVDPFAKGKPSKTLEGKRSISRAPSHLLAIPDEFPA